MKRQIVIGDIHGALKALQQLINEIRIKKNDRLVFLGDYVDGWPQSADVIDYLIELSQEHDCIFIRGNHDTWCELWLGGEQPDSDWLFHGGLSTMASYMHSTQEQKIKHLDFFNRMKHYHVDEHNRLFIHAGFASMHGPEKEHYVSNYSWDRTLWETALATDERLKTDSVFYPKRLRLFPEVYIGHTPTLNYNIALPMKACNVWNVDTGAAFMGPLSALCVETKEIWQSEIVQHLYPNDKGRNR